MAGGIVSSGGGAPAVGAVVGAGASGGGFGWEEIPLSAIGRVRPRIGVGTTEVGGTGEGIVVDAMGAVSRVTLGCRRLQGVVGVGKGRHSGVGGLVAWPD